jgi:hypothetical protein
MVYFSCPQKNNAGRTRRVWTLLLGLALSLMTADWPAAAQSPITARLDRDVIAADEVAVLTVTVTGDLLNIPTPKLGSTTDFDLVGSSTSTQISLINGQLTSQGMFVFRLQPLTQGELVIPPVSVTTNGQTYQTEPLSVRVLPGSAPNNGPAAPDTLNDQVFVEAEVDNPTPYLGQQIIFTFRLYQAPWLLRQPDYRPPTFTNFWGKNVLSQPQYNTVQNGRDLVVTEVRTALFPASVGQTTIDPARLVISGGFLEPDIMLETKPVVVDVKPLPAGAPPRFNGAVGQFTLTATVDPPQTMVNEPVTFKLSIEGAGNIEVLTQPPFPDLPGWRVFDSQVTTNITVQDDTVVGVRKFERLLVPGRSGSFTIPAITFSYFNPQSGQYLSTSTEPLPVTVLADDSAGLDTAAPGTGQQPVALNAGDIRHIKPVPTVLRSAGSSVLAQPLYYGGWLLPALVVVSVWLWQQRRQRLQRDTVYARRYNARRTAHAVLTQANADGYAAAQWALLGYLADKLNRPTAGLTSAGLSAMLHQARLDPALIERVQAVLSQADIGRFAPVGQADAQALRRETRRLIDALEKAWGR